MQLVKVVSILVPGIVWSCLLFGSAAAQQQQYPNYEEQKSLDGGVTGTYGNRNFDLPPQPGQISPRLVRPLPRDPNGAKSGNSGATHRSCVVDSYGNAVCR